MERDRDSRKADAPPRRAAATPDELRRAVEAALPVYGVRAAAAQHELFVHYLAAVAQANQRVRLVGRAAAEELAARHLGESLALGQALRLDRQRVVDIGSGAGFPGLALALGWPELSTTLVESNQKKAAFLRSVAETLALGNRVAVRAEFLERRAQAAPPWLAAADLVTVRALERMETVPDWLGRRLRPGTPAAFWVTDARAEGWRREYPSWQWGVFHALPASEHRGILLGRSPDVSRGT